MTALRNSKTNAGFTALVQITALYSVDKDDARNPSNWVAAGWVLESQKPMVYDGRPMDRNFPTYIVMVTPDDANCTLKDLNDLVSPLGSIVKLKNIQIRAFDKVVVGGWEIVQDIGKKAAA